MRLPIAILALILLPALQTGLALVLPPEPFEWYCVAVTVGFVLMALGIRRAVRWALGGN